MLLRFVKYNNKIFPDSLNYGKGYQQWIDKLNAFLLAIAPILQHYKGLYKNGGFTILIIVAGLAFFRFLSCAMGKRINRACIIAIMPLLIFQVYKTLDHSITASKTLYGVFMLAVFIEIASGTINAKYFVKYASFVGELAAICLMIQYLSFYILGRHITMVPVSILLPESDVWLMGVKTGLYGLRGVGSGFYRPSAFFLEPSHLFIYCFPVLCMNLLFSHINNWRKRKSILISIGIILSTSGMGIPITIAIWIIYVVFYNSSNASNNKAKISNLFKGQNLFLFLLILVAIFIAYFKVSMFRNSMLRIFGLINEENSSAIDARTRLARNLVQGLSGKNLLFGLTDNVDDIDFNLSGFYATLYKYGIIGIVLSYLFYVKGMFRLKNAYFWLSCIIVVISFFTAHTHGTFYMLYYVVLLMNGYYDLYSKKVKQG